MFKKLLLTALIFGMCVIKTENNVKIIPGASYYTSSYFDTKLGEVMLVEFFSYNGKRLAIEIFKIGTTESEFLCYIKKSLDPRASKPQPTAYAYSDFGDSIYFYDKNNNIIGDFFYDNRYSVISNKNKIYSFPVIKSEDNWDDFPLDLSYIIKNRIIHLH